MLRDAVPQRRNDNVYVPQAQRDRSPEVPEPRPKKGTPHTQSRTFNEFRPSGSPYDQRRADTAYYDRVRQADDEREQSALDSGRGARLPLADRTGAAGLPFAERVLGTQPPSRRPQGMPGAPPPPPDPLGLAAGPPSLDDALRAYYAQRMRSG